MFQPLSESVYFIELVYSFKTNKNSFLEFSIDHLRINLCLPYILKLYQMAMDAITPSSQVNQKSVQTQVQAKHESVEKPRQSMIIDTTKSNEQNPINESNGSLNVKAKINLPEVVLFAQPEKSNSKILFMNVNFFIYSILSSSNQINLFLFPLNRV